MEDGDDYWISLSEEGFVWELDAPVAEVVTKLGC
ncbi:MAG: hypothetical protein CM15mP23_08720 [Cryomorphaceae bacterium]|nr:MAG: hypothetical protein CM15mP23_08720 [Cryomorphaceae bacterium]